MNKRGFALIEMVVVLGIITILFSLTVPQLFRLRDRNTLQTATTQLMSIIRGQQLRAMNEIRPYGIHFDQSKYVQFAGLQYSNTDPTNTETILEYPLAFTAINVPSSELIFASGSGEIVAFDPDNRSFILEDAVNHEQRQILFNALGVLVSQ